MIGGSDESGDETNDGVVSNIWAWLADDENREDVGNIAGFLNQHFM